MIPNQFVFAGTPKEGIVVNVPEMRLYHYLEDNELKDSVVTYPVSIGRADWNTPEGQMTITAKALDPTWRLILESIRKEHAEAGEPLDKIVPAGPENPLGRHVIRLNKDGYLIHGTNRPYGIGMRVTHGCIRMYPKDVETIFETAPLGTGAIVVNQPFKVGISNESVYLEVHPPLERTVACTLIYMALLPVWLNKKPRTTR